MTVTQTDLSSKQQLMAAANDSLRQEDWNISNDGVINTSVSSISHVVQAGTYIYIYI